MIKKLLILIAVLSVIGVHAKAQTISGRVTSAADGSGAPGVTVSVKGASAATMTNEEGGYKIAAQSSNILVFSGVGFVTQEVTVGGRSVINVVLEEDNTLLEDVVVTALGISKAKRNLGYATAMIGASDIVKTASPNVATSLYGKAPGVNIQATPGGATSGVSVNIRGFSSITGSTQPLIVLNGVPMRNGDFNNGDYWSDQRIRGNGLNDINPADIESVSILKGASAAALYGSEAVNGVMLITTKSGKGSMGLGVDFNASYTTDRIAYLPRYQNVRGPGYPAGVGFGSAVQDVNGFFTYPDGARGLINTSVNFGPKFDGQPVRAWTGQMVPYESSNGGYDQLFQDANSSNVNVGVTKGGEFGSVRFSLTRQDNQMISRGAKNEKNVASLSSILNIGKRSTTSINIQYINQFTHNRPFKVDRMINNFTGMMDRFEKGQWYFDRAITSAGYRYTSGTTPTITPDEHITGNGFKNDIADYAYQVLARNYNEYSNRIMASIDENFKLGKGFSIRGRIATDFTVEKNEDKSRTERPLSLGNPSGGYGLASNNFSLFYGDVYFNYENKISKDLELNAFVGYSARKETNYWSSQYTSGGLSTENKFDLSASTNQPGTSLRRSFFVTDALMGSADLTFRGFWNVQGTIRQDRTSVMSPDNNSFVYPSVNTALILSDVLNLPKAISFSKIRASWGVVGNYPSIYAANVAYEQRSLLVQNEGAASTIYTQLPVSFGNDGIKPEQKHEIEIGLENYFFGRRLGIDISYYNAQIRDQILPLTIAASTGASSVLSNIGTLRNQGIEVAITGRPIQKRDFEWNTILNLARNRNKVEKLANNSTELLHRDYDGNAAQLRSEVGRPMGDIYVRPIATDAQGRKIVNPNGLYAIDGDSWIRAGNAMPDLTGGFINDLKYKNFDLSIVTSFQVGGSIMPTGIAWMTSRGLTEESTKYMDAASGGLSYYIDQNGKGIQTTASVGPGGEKVHHDGMLMDGVTAEGQPNTNVISQAIYYNSTYNWGGPQYSNSRYELYVQSNDFWKLRELSLGYNLPSAVAKKVGAQNVNLSVFGRNLFFLYRNIKDLDPEQTVSGSKWTDNINTAGNNPSFRSFGVMLRASF
jgi:iron complex outermembrane receptor protein